ncbi:hypothetical protein [Paracoccus sp. JM45]|uniref:hypothetical protein n=1 Tax=Paracoccus sp. JM45 TaxID=2283626 RepID=UPI000E6C0038|nr:hypothetical protein [Paracoccus sp. JM45]RJE81271.1 hypothetical protein DWB67_01025 [Paracoccus sp. JM45]
MAIFSYLATTALWASVTATIGTTAAGVAIAAGQSIAWSIAGALLTKSSVSRQEMMATLSQTDMPRLRAYGRNLMGGLRVFYEGGDGALYQIIVVHHGAVDGLIAFWWDGEAVTTGTDGYVARYKRNYFNDGSGNGGDFSYCDHGPSDDFRTLWTSAHRLEHQAAMLVFFGDPSDEDFPKVFPKQSQTQVQAEIRGVRVLNLSGNAVYTENAGLCLRDFMTHPDGWNIPLARLNSASWAAFVNRCAEQLPVLSGGTQARYRLAGYYSLNDPLKDTTARMLATCDGQIYETAEGNIGILGGAWSDPEVTITADDILSIEMDEGFDPFTDYNVLKPSFVSPDHGYQVTEVAEIRDEVSLLTQEERFETYEVDMCPASPQLQRLAKIKMAKDRREYVGTMTTNLVGMKARFPKGDGVHTIRILADEFGLNDVFEVTSHSFDVENRHCTIGIASLSNPYGWTSAEEKPMPTTVDELGLPVSVQSPPTNRLVVQEIVDVSGGVNGVKLVVSVDAPGSDGLTLKAQVAPGTQTAEADADWIEMGASRRRAETGVLSDLGTYTVRVKWAGRSEWVVAGTRKVVANPTVPAAPTQFDAVATGTNVYLDWRNPGSGFYRTQIYRNTVNDFTSAALVDTIGGTAGQNASYTDELSSGASGMRRYWAVTINGSGVPSSPAGPATVTL